MLFEQSLPEPCAQRILNCPAPKNDALFPQPTPEQVLPSQGASGAPLQSSSASPAPAHRLSAQPRLGSRDPREKPWICTGALSHQTLCQHEGRAHVFHNEFSSKYLAKEDSPSTITVQSQVFIRNQANINSICPYSKPIHCCT